METDPKMYALVSQTKKDLPEIIFLTQKQYKRVINLLKFIDDFQDQTVSNGFTNKQNLLLDIDDWWLKLYDLVTAIIEQNVENYLTLCRELLSRFSLEKTVLMLEMCAYFVVRYYTLFGVVFVFKFMFELTIDVIKNRLQDWHERK